MEIQKNYNPSIYEEKIISELRELFSSNIIKILNE
jgi:hypothetical protein